MTARLPILAAAFVLSGSTASADETDFNDVGKWMSITLQNGHFERLPFSKLSSRFLDHYLKTLDPGKVYFTRQDIVRFEKDYGDSLDDMLMKRECMTAATAISRVFALRVAARVEEAVRLLAIRPVDFARDEAILASRKDAPWPRDEAEAMAIWRQEVKEALLAEILRSEALAADGDAPAPDPRSPEEKLLARYQRLLADVAADSAPAKVAASFLSAVAQSFDPHTDYMSARDVEFFNEDMRNQVNGIGVTLQGDPDGTIRIRSLVPNGPASRQGELKPGDRVIAIDPDGEGPQETVDIAFMRIDRVAELVRGRAGLPVTLKVEPAPGAAGTAASISIPRAEVTVAERQASAQVVRVKGEAGERKLGVITLPSFYRDFERGLTCCSLHVEKLLVRLKGEEIDGLLIDLRGNGGGAMTEVQRMTGFFTGPAPVVQVRDNMGRVVVLESNARDPLYGGPLVVLTDRGSASASEIFAGALQDDNRAVIVGDFATFGKGTVQVLKDLAKSMPFFSDRSGAGALRLTIQKFYRPSGLSTQNRGVIPDVILPGADDARERGEGDLDFALEHDGIAPAPGFRPLDRKRLFIPELAAKSAARVAASRDFLYLTEDAAQLKQLIAGNRINLNFAVRMKESEENTARARQRDEERRERFATIVVEDGERMEIYPLTLADIERGGELRPPELSEMQAAPVRRPAPTWPSDLDPQKREAMSLLGDLIDATARSI